MFDPASDSNFRHDAPAQFGMGPEGDGGQLVRLRIVAVGRPVPLAAMVFVRSFSVERSHRAPAARLPADGLVPIPMPRRGRKDFPLLT